MLKTISFVFSALCLIVIGDTAGKLLTSSGFAPFFVAWLRFTIAFLLLFPLCSFRLTELPNFLNRWVLLRSILIVGGICCILTALRTEPIANVFGIFFISPIAAFFLSALLLGEKITFIRTLSLIAGFAGVLLIVKPGFGMSPGIFFALGAGLLHGAYIVATRRLAGAYRPQFLLISQLLLGAIILFPFGLQATIPTFGGRELWLICLSAIGSAAGNYMLVIISRTTPASVIAPLIYTQLIAAAVAGYVVFGDWPDSTSLLGMGLILSSGFLSFSGLQLPSKKAMQL